MLSVQPAPATRPLGRYFGGKWRQRKLLLEIFESIEHRCYVEPFGGFFSLGLAKPKVQREVYNDLHPGNLNLMRVLRGDGRALVEALERSQLDLAEFELCEQWDEPGLEPLEMARRYLLHAQASRTGGGGRWSSGTDAARLQRTDNQSWGHLLAHWERMEAVVITGVDALESLEPWDYPTTLFYLDPPYPWDTRGSKDNRHANPEAAMPRKQYRHEYTDEQHGELLARLNQLQGSVVLSGYDCPLYNQALTGWERYEQTSRDSSGAKRVEVIWVKRAGVSRTVETMLRGREETRTLDALGRGRGDGRRGGVRAVQLTRKLKRGKGQATYTQWRLQWEEPRGGGVYSATRNLRKAIASDVRRDWEAGLTVKEICKKYQLEKPKHG